MIGRETSAYPSTAVVVASSIASTPSTIALLTPMAASSAPRGASRPLILCLNIYFYIPTTKHAKSIPNDLSLSPHLSLSLLLGICSLKSFLKLSNWSMFNHIFFNQSWKPTWSTRHRPCRAIASHRLSRVELSTCSRSAPHRATRAANRWSSLDLETND